MGVWTNACEVLKKHLPLSTYSLWIEPLQCAHESESLLELEGSDQFFCSWIEDNYLHAIRSSLQTIGLDGLDVKISVGPDMKKAPEIVEHTQDEKIQLCLPNVPTGKSKIKTLHPRYTFEEFVVGDSNKFAQSACVALANGDMNLGKCLYIGASTGLGKSHLTNAVAHHILNHSPLIRLHYLTAQQLSSEVVNAVKGNTIEAFKEKYYSHCDVLIMEDIQSLTGKNRTQEELAFALDVLMKAGKRIIFTGSVGPKDIPDIAPTIRSRLSSGLITCINPPEFRTRMQIIKYKSRKMALDLPDNLVEFMAEHIKGDIRHIESALVGVKAKASLLQVNPDITMVKEVINNLIDRPRSMSTKMIRDYIAEQFKVSIEELCSKSRKKTITFPRQVCMFLSRKLTDEGLSDIGKALNRDHSTVVHSIRVVTENIARSASIRGQVELLSDKVKMKFQ